MITQPNAKINLGLHVVERRTDGYHNLETIFYPIPLQDRIEVTQLDPEKVQEAYQLLISGVTIEGDPEQNLIIKVLRQLKQEFEIPPLKIEMRKQIPTGAGLGGGSADAAFMMKLLNEQFSLGLTHLQMEERVGRLGADCPFFIQNKPVLAKGTGNLFSPISLSLKGYHLVLVKPAISVPTKDAFALIKPRYPEHSLEEIINQPIAHWKDSLVNDFERSIFPKYPQIAEIKNRLYTLGATYAAMSGSGASLFGLFAEPLDHAEAHFQGCFCWQSAL